MHLTTTTTSLVLISIITSTSAFDIIPGSGTFLPPDKTSVLSAVRAAASTQETQGAFASEISKIPEAKGHNIPSDIASVESEFIYGHHGTSVAMPAWMSAAPTNGAIWSAIDEDTNNALDTLINGASKVTGSKAESAMATKASETTTKTSETTTESTTSTSTHSTGTSTSTGGVVGQSTGALMGAGAAAAGVLMAAALL